ncbi:MAG: DUF4340 domain-containing protein [Planctomycetota bacterium]|nr:DUF4340 domain-containing protein [Planctomycetota bacterium]
MSGRTTLILLLLGLAAGGWLYWDLNRPETPDERYGPLLRDFPAEAVNRIELQRSVAVGTVGATRRERLVFEKRGADWFLAEPVEGKAGKDQVHELLYRPVERWSDSRVPADPGKRAEYGLEDDAIRVTLAHPLGQAVFRIGRRIPVQQIQYVWLEGSDLVAVLDMEFGAAYAQPMKAYLERAPANETPAQATEPTAP